MTLRVLDIETTGPDPEVDEIIEIASIDLVRGGGYTLPREVLVNPGRAISIEASAVHHLVDADVEMAPPIDDVIDQFAGATIYVAHNAQFERGFLYRHWPEARWLCTYKCALRHWPDAPGHSNQVLRYWQGFLDPFGVPRGQVLPHRALSDVLVTGEIAQRLIDEVPFKILMDWSGQPALHTRLTFGKHKGLRFDEAPRDYLEWIANKSDMGEDMKFSARHWLGAGIKAAVNVR